MKIKIYCHERGCPNFKMKEWNGEFTEKWICSECRNKMRKNDSEESDSETKTDTKPTEEDASIATLARKRQAPLKDGSEAVERDKTGEVSELDVLLTDYWGYDATGEGIPKTLIRALEGWKQALEKQLEKIKEALQ